MARLVYREMRSLAVFTVAPAPCRGLSVPSGRHPIDGMPATKAVPTNPSNSHALIAGSCGGACALDLSQKFAPSAHAIHGTRSRVFHASPQPQQTLTSDQQAQPSIEAFLYSQNLVAAGWKRANIPTSSVSLCMQRASLANCACNAR